MIRFQCERCGHFVRFPEQLAGRRRRCPLCGAAITVPVIPPELLQAPGPSRKHQSRRSVRTVVWAVAATVVIVPGILAWRMYHGTSDRSPANRTAEASESGAAAAGRIERQDLGICIEAFDLLSDGLSYSDAVKVIGAEGTLTSSSILAGVQTQMYSWKASQGAKIDVQFQNGRLIAKAQSGLK